MLKYQVRNSGTLTRPKNRCAATDEDGHSSSSNGTSSIITIVSIVRVPPTRYRANDSSYFSVGRVECIVCIVVFLESVAVTVDEQ